MSRKNYQGGNAKRGWTFACAIVALPILFLCARAQEAKLPEPPPKPLFSPAERSQIVNYWGTPERYEVGPRDNAETEGPWVVRLTPEASAWHHRYQRSFAAGKMPPTQKDVIAPDANTQKWEDWVAAKVAYDRWSATQEAAALNAPFVKATAREAARTPAPNPADAPSFPGVMPADLEAAVGTPPRFAAVVAPKKHTVRFDDGYVASYHDHIGLSRPRYAYYRFHDGVSFSGVAVRNWPQQEVDRLFARAGMTPFEQNVAKAISRMEGGFESVNTYDTGYVSVGFIQFASLSDGGGSLGGLMRQYKRNDAAGFENDFRRFGIDVSDEGKLVVVDPHSGGEARGPEANARIIADKRLIAVFQRAGKVSDGFRVAQIQNAKARFYPANFNIAFTLGGREISGKVSDIIKSEAGMATLFDRSVNTGNIRLLNSVLPALMTEKKLTSLEQVIPFEREIIKRMKWRHDFLTDKSLSQPE